MGLFDILKSGDSNKDQMIQGLRKQNHELKANQYEFRPSMAYTESFGNEGKLRITEIHPVEMWRLCDISDTCQIIVNAIVREEFRNGVEVIEKYVQHCEKCKVDYDSEQDGDVCPECGEELIEPDPKNRQRLDELVKKANDNKQALKSVAITIAKDLEQDDNGFCLIHNEYSFLQGRELRDKRQIKEVLRIHPLTVDIIADSMGRLGRNDSGERVFFCPIHRDKIHPIGDDVENPLCPQCGTEMFQANYRSGGTTWWGEYSMGTEKYYASHEIIHLIKYNPSLIRGRSNFMPSYHKIRTLRAMDIFMEDAYVNQRVRGIIIANTSNQASFDKAWKSVIAQVRSKPNEIPAMSFESSTGTKEFVKYEPLMPSPEEMNFIDVRNEFRRQIGANFGVTPIFNMDTAENSGGDQGHQITVHNRAVQDGQECINEQLFNVLCEEILHITDYTIRLKPNEKRDEMTEQQELQLKIQNAQQMKTLGMIVSLKDGEEIEFEYKMPEEGLPQTDSFGNPQGGNPAQGSGQTHDINTPTIQDQRFEGEPMHDHESQNQKFEGEPIDVKRAMPISKKKLQKEGGAVTTSSAGSFNPVYSRLKQHIIDHATDIEKSEGFTVNKEELSRQIAEKLYDTIFRRKFQGISKANSDLIKDRLIEAIIDKNYDYDKLAKEITKLAGKDYTREEAERVVRTEMQNLNNTIRENTFRNSDPEGKRKAVWISTPDYRRTHTCAKITERAKNGVTLEELKQIIKEEADQNTYDESRPWNPHINCRSNLSWKKV